MKLVLLPGMDGTGELFSEFIAALPEQFEAVAVGYPAEQRLPYSELENFVWASCLICEPFVVIAESFSTPLALKYAATNPANLQGVVLCAGFARSPMQGWRRLLASFIAPVVFYAPMPNFAARHWLVGEDASPSLVAAVRAAIFSVQPRVLAARLRAMLASDVRGVVGQISVPILYIRAEQDRLVNALCLEELRQIKPEMSSAVIAGPHLLLQRRPQRAAEAIVRFIEGKASGSNASTGYPFSQI